MTVIKRNQIIVLSLSIMIVVAGYLNYTYKGTTPFTNEVTGSVGERLGEATLVDNGQYDVELGRAEPASKALTNSPTTSTIEKKDNNIINSQLQNPGDNNTSSQSTQSNNADQYFTETRAEREQTRDEEISLHESVIGNQAASKEAQEKAQAELTAISGKWEAEMIIERLIKAKGFKDAVVFINQGSVNVVVLSGGQLTPAQAAQIQDIVMREAKVPADGIKIVTK